MNVQIEMDGQVRRDVRFAPLLRRKLTAPSGAKRAEAIYCIDLSYRGPRGS